jgi:hypothetical protein
MNSWSPTNIIRQPSVAPLMRGALEVRAEQVSVAERMTR